MEKVALSGKPKELPALMRERYQGLADRVLLRYALPTADSEAKWRTFVKAFHAGA